MYLYLNRSVINENKLIIESSWKNLKPTWLEVCIPHRNQLGHCQFSSTLVLLLILSTSNANSNRKKAAGKNDLLFYVQEVQK